MLDVVFDVSGDTLPPNYPFALWHSLLSHAPFLSSDPAVGVIPLRTTFSAEGMLLPKRSKLVLRLPGTLAAQASALSGVRLEIATGALQLGNFKLRPIQAYPTLHASLVNSDADEVSFLAEVSARLAELNIAAKLICGMRTHLTSAAHSISGFSLVIHDLKPDASLHLQYTGLASQRNFGCGIFLPHKTITDLD